LSSISQRAELTTTAFASSLYSSIAQLENLFDFQYRL